MKLTRPQRIVARERAVQAALLALDNADALHYTQGGQRWQGIDDHLIAARGFFPDYADCSSFATWCLWNALRNGPDVVNGTDWESGWTGTLVQHGREIRGRNTPILRGDLVLYGESAPFRHVAIVVGHDDGKPVVVSHGSEAGPLLLSFDYRPDVGQVRRYIHAD